MDKDLIRGLLNSEDYVDLFAKNLIKESKDIVEYIETYKILTEDELIDGLNRYFNTDKFVKPTVINRAEEYRDVEMRRNIVIHKINSSNTIVYYNGFEKCPFEDISMDLEGFSGIKFIPTTPGIIKRLLGITIPRDKINYDFYLASMVLDCVKQGGSDVHIIPISVCKEPKFKVSFRLVAGYKYQDKYDMDENMNHDLIFKLASRQTKGNEQDIKIGGLTAEVSDLLDNGKYTLRVGANACTTGYSCVIRIQAKDTVSLKIDELGFDKDAVEKLKILSNYHKGLTMITGPVRSGKNTTIFALVNSMLDLPIKIQEYSSPVELLMPIVQVDYQGSVGALADYIKLAKKQDIDLAIINEIPDNSIAFGIRDLVNSSIGVLTTTHLDRVWYFPHKLKEYFGDGFKDLITQINGVVHQMMFVKQCPYCRETIMTSEIDVPVREFLDKFGVKSVGVSKGCSKCQDGLMPNGMQPFTEIMIFDRETKRQLLSCETPSDMEAVIYDKMMDSGKSLDHKVSEAVERGDLHYKSIYKVIS
ncbi:hypothetical protein UT300012_23860 [Paraclostridium bifermentans]